MLLVKLRIRRLVLQDVARGALLAEECILLPALVPQDQQDIDIVAEDLTNFGDRLADRLRGPRTVPGLQRNRSDTRPMDMPRELDDAVGPVDVARHPVVHPHRAIGAVLDAGAGDLDDPAYDGAVAEVAAAGTSGAAEEILLGIAPCPQQVDDLGPNHGGSLQAR